MSLASSRPWAAWGMYFVVASYSIFQLFLQGSVGLVADHLKLEFATDATSIGVLASLFFYPYILMQLPAGVILDRWGHRKVLTVGMALIGVSTLVFASATSMGWAMGARILMGAVCAFGFVGLLSGVMKLFDVRSFSFMVALGETLTMLLASRLNIGASWLVELGGWRYGFLAAAMVAFGLSAVLWITLGRFPKSVTPAHQEGTRASLSVLKTFEVLLKRKEIWAYGVISGCLFSIVTVFAYLWAVPFVQKGYDLDLYEATKAVSLIYVGIGLFSPVVGVLASRVHKLWLLLGSAFASAVLFVCIVYATEWVGGALRPMLFALGLACSGYHMSFAIVGEKLEESFRTCGLALTNMITMLWAPLLQTLVGVALSRWSESSDQAVQVYAVGDYQRALILLVCNLVCAFGLIVVLLKKEVLYVLRDRPTPIPHS